MFSFRSDKTGFFVTIILIALLVAAVVTTAVVAAFGWQEHKGLLKVVWGTWWVLCIATVLVRLAIFRWQMIRAQRRKNAAAPAEDGPARQNTPEG